MRIDARPEPKAAKISLLRLGIALALLLSWLPGSARAQDGPECGNGQVDAGEQ
jgi:hypothetical protein